MSLKKQVDIKNASKFDKALFGLGIVWAVISAFYLTWPYYLSLISCFVWFAFFRDKLSYFLIRALGLLFSGLFVLGFLYGLLVMLL